MDGEQFADANDADITHEYVPAGTKHYQVEISTDPGFTLIGRRVLLTTTDNDSLVPEIAWNPSETYYWRVRAVDGASQVLTWSATQTLADAIETAAPETLCPVLTGAPMASLTWAPVPGAASYEVELNSDDGSSFPLGSLVAGYPKTSEFAAFTPPAQLPSGDFSWRVRAVDAFGIKGAWGPGPDLYPVRLPTPSLGAPGNGVATTLGQLNFTWNPVDGRWTTSYR